MSTQTSPTATVAARPRSLVRFTVLLAALVLVVDQLSKWWAVEALEGRDTPIHLIGDFLTLTFFRNPGAALGIGYGYTAVLTVIIIAVVVVIVRVIYKIQSKAWAWALALMLGGALGNLGDRIFRQPGLAQGHVVDFIGYSDWFVGNIADIAIVAAAALIVLLAFLGIGFDGKRDKDAAKDSAANPGSGAAQPAEVADVQADTSGDAPAEPAVVDDEPAGH
ncbi:MAG: signal peptidase II [Cellulomonadaceae bacterium]|nr:signal peptidase II [Cellulomonadaceae bacterium]